MYSVSCSDLGFTACGFVAEGKSPRKVKDQFFAHARDVHPELLTGITDVQRKDLERQIESHLVEEAAA
jgi:predicted small metal-binding protein